VIVFHSQTLQFQKSYPKAIMLLAMLQRADLDGAFAFQQKMEFHVLRVEDTSNLEALFRTLYLSYSEIFGEEKKRRPGCKFH
jgi:hypothetical protein